MNRRAIQMGFLVFLLFLLTPLQVSAVTAREKLVEMRIPFTEEEFLKRVENGDAEAVKLFLAAGMDPNTMNNGNVTPLMLASMRGHIQVVKYLLDKGADVNMKSVGGFTALIYATDYGDAGIAEMLLEHGADVHASSNRGYTALLAALQPMCWSRQAEVKSKVTWKQGFPEIPSRRKFVEAFIDKGADVNTRNHLCGTTPLMFFASLGDANYVASLLNLGANINEGDSFGYTALMIAAGEGHTEVVKVLVKKGADVNTKTKDAKTALILAQDRGHTDIVKALIAHGADVNPQDASGRTPLRNAKKALARIANNKTGDRASMLEKRQGRPIEEIVQDLTEIVELLNDAGAVDIPISIYCDNKKHTLDIAEMIPGEEMQVCGKVNIRIKRIVRDFVMKEDGTVVSRSDYWRHPAILVEYPLPDGSTREDWFFKKYPDVRQLSYSSQEKGFVIIPR